MALTARSHNIFSLAVRYYRLYGARFFFIRLYNTLLDAAFARLSPLFGLARRLPPLSSDSGSPDIFFLSGNEWELRKQRPQQLAEALARLGCAVHYCAPSSCAAAASGWRLTRKKKRLWHLRFFSDRAYRLKDVDSPGRYAGFAASLQHYIRLAARAGKAVIVVQQPIWELHLRGMNDTVPIYYDCIDDHGDFPDAPPQTASCEKRLVERAQGIIYTAEKLGERFLEDGKTSVIIRNACEYEFFAGPYPGERSGESGKIIGYHGALSKWFDADLAAAVAAAFPRHTVRLIGAYIPEVKKRLAPFPNVELLGEMDYKRLPAYVRGFDVGLLPFRIQPLTLGTNPVKIYEYLAAGLPVVATPLPEMAQFGSLVRTGEGEDFIRQVEAALAAPRSPEEFAAQQAFARRETWDERAKALREFIRASDY